MSMSCSINSTVTSVGKARDGGENFVAFVLGNSGCRFIEQQHAWTAGDRDRDLQQTLLAVGQYRGALYP